MYLINRETNRIQRLEEKTFAELGFKEREHLQEWIANDPCCLGEELLIIQKEFDGFSETRERLDLLALDKEGNLVIIENKLDDTGRDVTWQALKYASYCSTLSKDEIRKIYQDYLDKRGFNERAEEKLAEFFNIDYEDLIINKSLTQRVILVAANFRKEVTSTVFWLLNYNLKIQCFKVRPYSLEGQLFLNIEQIIPMKDAEDYLIKMAEKAQEDKNDEARLKTSDAIKYEFWVEVLKEMNKRSNLFQNISPQKSSWICAGSGIRGVPFQFVMAKSYARIELYIDTGNKGINKELFDYLYSRKEQIQKKFGNELIWERLDDKRASRIKYETLKNCYNKDEWNEIVEFLVSNMIKFEQALQVHLKNYKIMNK